MSGAEAAWLVILGGGLATYTIRASFLAFAGRMTQVAPAVREALRMIPAAALSALVVPALLRTDGAFDALSARSLAGALAAVIAFRTRNVVLTIAVGMLAVVLFGLVPDL